MADYSFYSYTAQVLVYDQATDSFVLDAGYDPSTDRNRIEYSDDDATFDGFDADDGGAEDANQIGTAYDDQGNVVADGQVYAVAFAVLQDGQGGSITIDRIEVNGVHVGYVPSAPLTPGQAYPVVSSSPVNADNGNTMGHSYYETNSVPCFDAQTLIETPSGPRCVADICAGDLVETLDLGVCPVVWRCSRHV